MATTHTAAQRLCLYDRCLRRVRSWRARLGDELLEGLVIDSIVEAEEAADACRHVAPVPGGEDALRTPHTATSFPTNGLSARPKDRAGKGVASAMHDARDSKGANTEKYLRHVRLGLGVLGVLERGERLDVVQYFVFHL
jgi:hypothetical protein